MSLPWLDRAGRLSLLKLCVFLLVLAPAFDLAWAYAHDALGAKPVTTLVHATGEWAMRILLATLAVTPLRRIANWPKLIGVRRMLGLAALAYALAHLALYVVDQNFVLTKVISEIALRFYLTIGFVALAGLVALGATSTDGAIRRMGPAWNRLHRLVYGITALGLLHYFLQAKIDVTNPVFWTGLFLLLMGWRGLQRLRIALRPWSLGLLAAGTALLTALLEAAWYGLKSGVPADLVLGANLGFSGPLRPAWWVLAVGLGLPLVNALRGQPERRRPEMRSAGDLAPARAMAHKP